MSYIFWAIKTTFIQNLIKQAQRKKLIMSIEEPIQPSLQIQLQAEKLFRPIQDFEDISILRAIALEL